MHDQCITRLCSQYRTTAVGLGPPPPDGGQIHLVCAILSMIGLELLLNTVFRGACGYELVFSGPSWSALDKPFWLDVVNSLSLSKEILHDLPAWRAVRATRQVIGNYVRIGVRV